VNIELNNDTLLTPTQLADYLSLKPKTLEAMRRRGDDPKLKKLGRTVRYLSADIRA
jgi:predicted DNA-binding transcriptional regulator AlpA